MSIRAKVVVVSVAALAICAAVSLYVGVIKHRRQLVDGAQQSLLIAAEIVNRTVQQAMLDGEAPTVATVLGDLGMLNQAVQVTLYRTDGHSAFSDDSTVRAVNERLGGSVFPVGGRAEATTVDTPGFRQSLVNKSPVTVAAADGAALDLYYPILNYPDCRSCHGSAEFVRGIAHLQLATAGLQGGMVNDTRLLSGAFAVIGVVLVVALLLLLQGSLVSPLRAIGRVVERISAGDYRGRAFVGSNDEVGRLGTKVDLLAVGLSVAGGAAAGKAAPAAATPAAAAAAAPATQDDDLDLDLDLDAGTDDALVGLHGFLDDIERAAAGIAAEHGKSVRVRGDAAVDALPHLEQLKDSVLLLVRNAIEHGVESEEDRVAAGKDETATIEIKVAREGEGGYRLDVGDDGRGLDFERIEQRAVDLGLTTAGAGTRDLMRALVSPEFQAHEGGNGSGPGGGLAAVNTVITELGGRLSVATKPNRGTRFILRFPDA